MPALIAAFALIQFVTYTSCACGLFCGHKNACGRTEAPAQDDCCHQGNPAPGEEAPCFHLEPQGDLLADAGSIGEVPESVTVIEELPAFSASEPILPQVRPIGLSPPFQDRPLYLEHLSFRI